MGGQLMVVAAFMILGLVSAESVAQPPGTVVEISGNYLEGTGFNVSFSWTGDSQPEYVKLFWNKDKKVIYEYKPTPSTNKNYIRVDGDGFKGEYLCNTIKVDKKIGECVVTVNVTKEAADVELKAEACWKDGKCSNIQTNITFVESVVMNNEVLLICSSRGVPAPQFVWYNIQNDVTTEVNGTSYNYNKIWDDKAKMWSSNSTYAAEKVNMVVRCCSKLRNDPKTACKEFTINSSDKIGTPGVYAVLLLVLAYVSKSVV